MLPRTSIGTLALLLLMMVIIPIQRVGAQAAGPRTVFNDDGQVIAEIPETGASDFVKAWLDREAEFVPFTTFVFLAATPDICTYDTKAGERYGARFGDEFDGGWATGMRRLSAEGTDPLRLVATHMKAKGYEVMAAVRMNDTHHRTLDPGDPLCPQFAIDHPEFVIKQPDGRTNETALDYSHDAVREHRLAIMREIAEDYEVDGLELNFVRWAKHFPRDQGREKAPIMTAFMKRVRATLDAAAEKRGLDRLVLGVRVPESVDACWLAGIDIRTWVEKGWVDYVAAATWNNTDPQLPVDQFAAFTKPAGVQLLVLMGNMIGAIWSGPPVIYNRDPAAMSPKHAAGYQGMLITEAEARAAAANYYAWGADGISLWNVGIHFGGIETGSPAHRDRIKRWTHAVCDPAKLFEGKRWYHYLPMGKGISARKPPSRSYPWYDEGRSPLGHKNGPILEFTPESTGKRLAFPFRMADGRDGVPLKGSLRFRVFLLSPDDDLSIDINGKPVTPSDVSRRPVDPRAELPGICFTIDLEDCPPFEGDNELGLTLLSSGTREKIPYMEELEVFVD
jgi:hypothetical protein